MSSDLLRYPVGKFSALSEYSAEDIQKNIQLIRELPAAIQDILNKSTVEQLDTPYREGGWTIRQVVHHLADSHMHAFIRIKWALTENKPIIKAYVEKLWAETPETHADPYLSLSLLKSLHAKWVVLLEKMTKEDLKKTFIHPDSGKEIPMDRQIAIYAWHGQHHLGHIKLVVK